MTKDLYDVMNLKALRCLWAVGKRGSLVQAGIELGISEAAVSQRIKSLELYLGVKLYEARGGKIRFTPAGERSVEMASGLFEQLENFQSAVADDDSVGTISLCAHDGVLRYFLPDIVKRFSQEFPLSRLRLITRTFPETNRLVRTNEADLGIVPKHRAAGDLKFLPVATYEAFVLIPRGHPLVARRVPDVEDLLTKNVIERFPLVMATDDTDHHPIREVLAGIGLPLNVGLEVGTVETLKFYVSQGHGLGVLSGLCVTKEDAQFHAIRVPGELWSGTTYGVIHRPGKYFTEALTRLISLIGAPNSDS